MKFQIYLKSNPYCNLVRGKRQLVLSLLWYLRNQFLLIKAKLGKAEVAGTFPSFSFQILPKGCSQLDSVTTTAQFMAVIFLYIQLLQLTRGIHTDFYKLQEKANIRNINLLFKAPASNDVYIKSFPVRVANWFCQNCLVFIGQSEKQFLYLHWLEGSSSQGNKKSGLENGGLYMTQMKKNL